MKKIIAVLLIFGCIGPVLADELPTGEWVMTNLFSQTFSEEGATLQPLYANPIQSITLTDEPIRSSNMILRAYLSVLGKDDNYHTHEVEYMNGPGMVSIFIGERSIPLFFIEIDRFTSWYSISLTENFSKAFNFPKIYDEESYLNCVGTMKKEVSVSKNNLDTALNRAFEQIRSTIPKNE